MKITPLLLGFPVWFVRPGRALIHEATAMQSVTYKNAPGSYFEYMRLSVFPKHPSV
jgi:hypothetical protein